MRLMDMFTIYIPLTFRRSQILPHQGFKNEMDLPLSLKYLSHNHYDYSLKFLVILLMRINQYKELKQKKKYIFKEKS